MKKVFYGLAASGVVFVSLAVHAFALTGPGNPPPPPDFTPPTVSITSPVSGAVVSSTVVVTGTASDAGGVASVQLSIDNGTYVSVTGTSTWTYSWTTTALANGSHTLEAKATDASGNTGVSSITTSTVSNTTNTTPPSVPANLTAGTVTATTANISWTASNAGTYPIAGYQIYRCTGVCTPSVQVGTTTAASYADANLAASTTFTYSVAAYDTHGNQSAKSSALAVTTKSSSDTIAPTVSITSPANNATLFGTVSVNATATDNVGVAKVEFYLDGFLEAAVTTSPYAWSWTSASSTNGSHVLLAKAYDAAGNVGASTNVNVTVNNPDTQAPTVPTNLAVTGTTTSSVSLSWTASTDNVGVTGYKVYRCSGTCTPTTQIGTSTATAFVDTALIQNTTYSYAVSAFDAAGNNSAKSASVQGTTKFQDLIPPTVSVTSPANNATLSATTTLMASATDNVAVASVQFKIDGSFIGSPITAAPYSYVWDSHGATNGSHSLTAIAKDSSNNQATSSAITITVSNASSGDTQAPTVPTNLAVTGTTTSSVSLSWTASTDNVGVAGYKVWRGGVQVGTPTTTSYADTGLAASTTYSYAVSAFDAAGNNSGKSSAVSGTTLPAGDVTPPSVAITSPTDNQTVAGTVTISGAASDNVGIANVQISIDGGSYNGVNGTSSWSYGLDTTQLANGAHTVTAKASDFVGNTNSTAITITVDNQQGGGGNGGGSSGGGGTSSGNGSGGTTGGGTTGGGSTGTTGSLQALLQTLLTQLESLIAQLNTELVQTFTRNLTIGSTGSDVKNLQVFLNDNGYPIASAGSGSPGNESIYFGAKTAQALAKWQQANGIPATGFFGPLTRQYMQGKW